MKRLQEYLVGKLMLGELPRALGPNLLSHSFSPKGVVHWHLANPHNGSALLLSMVSRKATHVHRQCDDNAIEARTFGSNQGQVRQVNTLLFVSYFPLPRLSP